MNFKDITKWEIGGKEVKTLTIDGTIYWQKEEKPNYFYVEDISGQSNELFFKKNSDKPDSNFENVILEYSYDGKVWENWKLGSYSTPIGIKLKPNERVYIRGNNTQINHYNDGKERRYFDCTKNYKVGGNICSLIDKTMKRDDVSGNGVFCSLFSKSNTIIDASDLYINFKTMGDYSFSVMFYDCKNLITPPIELPSMNLGTNCYSQMFQNTNISVAPILKAKILSESCYSNMFSGCKNLQKVYPLEAEILLKKCYDGMFSGCSKLNEIKAYFITDPNKTETWVDPWGNYHSNYVYTDEWLKGTQAKGTFYKNKNATWNLTNSSGTNGWDIILVDPETDK